MAYLPFEKGGLNMSNRSSRCIEGRESRCHGQDDGLGEEVHRAAPAGDDGTVHLLACDGRYTQLQMRNWRRETAIGSKLFGDKMRRRGNFSLIMGHRLWPSATPRLVRLGTPW